MPHALYSRRDELWTFLLFLLFAASMTLPTDVFALAPDDDTVPVRVTICYVIEWFTGTTGRALATLAIIIIGVGALLGKISWGMAIIVAIGIAVVFGADQIFDAFAPGGSTVNNCTAAFDAP